MLEKLKGLTNSQKSIWFTEQYFKDTTVNTICGTAIIEEQIDFAKLEEAAKIVGQKHDVFKLEFKIENGEARQKLSEFKEFEIEIINLANLQELEKVRDNIIKTPFSIKDNFLSKFYIFKFENGQGAFMLNVHHLISDAWTLALICNDVIKTYSNLKQNQEIERKAIYSYIDYIKSEEEYLESEKYQKDKKYWEEKFEIIPEVAKIPGSKENEEDIYDINGQRKMYNIEKDFIDEIKTYCKENKISLYNFFMAIYAIYISEISNLNEFVIGTPILNRTNFKEKNAAGMFINVAPLKINLNDIKDFKTFVRNIAVESLSMLKHQKYSYQCLLENLREKDKKIPNLFNILLSYQVTNAQMNAGDIKYKTEWTFNGYCAEDIDIQIYDLNDTGSLNIAYDYRISKYNEKDIKNIHQRILNIIKQVISTENIDITDIDIITPDEKQKLIKEFNNTKLEYDKTETVISMFEKQVRKTPDKTAIISNGKTLTYKELNEKSNKLARKMIKKGITQNDIIGIMLNRSPEMIIGTIAVLKCGATYLPLDPEYPIERILYILENSETKTILVNNNTEKNIPTNCESINIEPSNKEIYNDNCENIELEIDSTSLAYLIYTSGSTGKPKGVMVTNQNLSNFINGIKKEVEFNENKTMLSVTTICFDIFGLELWCSLTSGLTLVIANEEQQNNPVLLNKLCLENKVNMIQTTPSRYSVVFEEKENLKFLRNITEILIGGEPISEKILSDIKKYTDAKIYNVYGPTETTIWSTVKELTKETEVTIGKPIANTQCYILNKNKKILPIGVPGELYIGGDGVSKGYLKRDDLNEEKFIKSPFDKSEKIYNTNDLAYFTEKGEIVHLGRTDFQVKIRGFRVELGEIENIISKQKDIKQCVVLKRKLRSGHDVLIAYYTQKTEINKNELKQALQDKLPQYMVPQYFIDIEKMPYTPNGKIDRKSLPEIDEQLFHTEIVRPRNKIDVELVDIISSMLKIENISIEDNLLNLGGDSLSAITLYTKVLAKFNVQINIKDILSNYTIREISDYIKENEAKEDLKIKIGKAPEQELYPLSSSQKRIYYNSKMIGDENTVYNMPGGIIVDEILEKEKVKKVFEKIIERHGTLRTSFVLKENDVFQKIEEKIDFDIPIYYNTEIEIPEIIDKFSKPFELEREPLIRVELHYIENRKTLLLVEAHHIIMDGTSLNNLIIEFNRLYNGENLKRIPIQYKDYSVWENEYNESESIQRQEEYWLNKFEDFDFTQLNLPYDYKILSNRSYRGNRVSNIIDERKFRKIERYAKKIGVSPYMLFISAFFILLYKYTGQSDITLGSPMANRNRNETKRMIGMFVNNIVIRGKINPEKTFKEFVDEIKNQVLDDLSNQPYPYDMLVKKLGIVSDNSRNPLFDVMFTYQNKEENVVKIGDKNCEIVEIDNKIAKFNLSLEIKPKTHTINMEYCTDLFERETIERLFDHYMNTLECIISDNNIEIKDISIIAEEEKNKIINEFNNSEMEYPKSKTIPELFAEQVFQNQSNIAVKHKEKQITYKELDEKSNHIANILLEKGMKSGDVIGVNLEKSIELIISIMAILKIGAIYMPMYIGYPKERLEYMLQNSNAKMLITHNNNELEFNEIKTSIKSLLQVQQKNEKINIETLNSNQIAYIIYTSGSTGKPKGVQIKHKNLINYIYAFKSYYNDEICGADKFLSSTNISFDVSIWEIFLPILNGATLVLYEEEIIQNILKYTESIVQNEITALYIPPNILEDVYNIIKNSNNIKINKMLVGVEPIRKHILNKYYDINENMIIINGYGPTETTICCTALKYEKDLQDGIVSIGRPLKNDNIYIVSSDKNIQPIGIAGEIFVTGDGIGEGYINKPAETKKNFLPNTFDKTSEKMYKTGDIAKWNEDGTICFIGRNDSQVKIAGHRIELSEITHCLMEYPSIIKAYTILKKRGERTYIVSYYMAEKEIPSTDLEIFLKEKLAEYMVPNFMIQLEQFPLTPNGKIDKEKLPFEFPSRAKYEPPRNEFEKQLVEIFKKLFLLKKVGIDDNFFEIGGDSLSAIKFQIEALNCGLKLTYSDIFTNPTIRMLSEGKSKKVKYKVDEKYDYTEINKIISKNNINRIEKQPKISKLNNVLLIGATGFLGSHILEQLILGGANKIYCLVREKSYMDPETRLRKNMEFYFGERYNNLLGDKIIVIDGDITDKKLGQKNQEEYEKLAQDINCVVHTAAIVKHYGDFKSFNDTNVEGTINIIELCKKFNKKLYYVSTLSVSGNIMKGPEDDESTIDFKENQLYIGQDLNNVYVYTKFEAEKKILEGIKDGLDACILRVGNITNRFDDGKFQINVSENAFINRLKSIIRLGVVQDKFLIHSLEFTPVDYCAEAIVKTMQNNPDFTVLHLFNNNFIKIDKLLKILEKLEEKIRPVSDKEFSEKINEVLKDKEMKNEINGIITDLDENKLLNLINYVIPNSEFTQKYLKTLGFEWPEIDEEYIVKYIEYFRKIKYI